MADLRQRRPAPAPATDEQEPTTPINQPEATKPQPTWQWSRYETWPAFYRFAPAIAILAILASILWWDNNMVEYGLDMRTYASCSGSFNYTFRINAVRAQAELYSLRSWEIGTAAEAIMEVMNPEKSVFAPEPFPRGEVPKQGWKFDEGLVWMYQFIDTQNATLFPQDGFSAADPASLGVAAVMVGRTRSAYMEAAERQKEYLLQDAPRYINSAISHRRDATELWADAISMFPPFLAYYGVHKQDLALVKEAVRQIQLYRDVLSISKGPTEGLWKHIHGPPGEKNMNDPGAWSTGNGWAAYGMARTRATISGWKASNESMRAQVTQLDRWIGEILDGAIRTDDDVESGLLRNYLGQSSWFGETSGTALLTATVYRMAVLNPTVFAKPRYLDWANAKRANVAARVDEDGFAKPAVNPHKHSSREPVSETAEGASFLLMMGAAWRDCICKGVCDPAEQGQVDYA
ncbi:hypothetical protein LTR62_008537 [Meristemomyces frigidus]|uniref:Uncharacterized protein n=1 Tax=Meristemomyces frigidus TaxID=1508187 RepID=A0AAN7TP74_9PEZI|nr:hypothetical protein LTR62_008537 [Meristemomyces frigidus]